MKNKSKKKNRFKKGITFIEILFYAGLLTVILGLLTNFLYQAMNYKVRNQIATSLLQNSQAVVNQLSLHLPQALSVTSPLDSNFTNQLILNTSEGQIIFDLDNGVLRKNSAAITDSQVEVILDPPESGFRKIGSTIQVRFSIKAKLRPFGMPSKQQDYQLTVFLNNDQN